MNVGSLYEHLKNAVTAEIAAQQAGGDNLRSLRTVWAERLHQIDGNQAIYRFETAKQVHPSLEDAPVVVDTGDAELPGVVIFASGYQVRVATEDVGESLGACQLLIDITFILERLWQLLDEQTRSPGHFEMETVSAVFGLNAVAPVEADNTVLSCLRCMNEGVAPRQERPNLEQRAAVALAAVAPVMFIWGPPGTGKTTTLAWIAEMWVRRGESVLLVSNTNVAVDRALTKLLDAVGTDPFWAQKVAQGSILRLGVSEQPRLQPLLLANFLDDSRADGAAGESGEHGSQVQQRRLVEQAELIACTLAKAATDRYLRQRRFDVVLIDEGSMAPLPYVAALSALCKRRVVIGGDFRQLPPISVVQDKEQSRWLRTDIFEQAGIVAQDGSVQHRWNLVSLAEQWRMREPICELVNEPLYGGMLRTPESLQGGGQDCLYLVNTASVRACSDRTSGHSHFNVASALVCVGLTQRLLNDNPFASVGIVTPYTAQASLIHAMLLDTDLAHQVRVATVHRFQGEERSIIVFDCVDAPPFGWVGQFLRGESAAEESTRLLNVAITRAQHQLYVVGDANYLERRLPPEALLTQIMSRIRSEGTTLDARAFLKEALEGNRSWRWVAEAQFPDELQRDLREAMRGRGGVTVMEAILRRDDGEAISSLLMNLLRAGVEVNILCPQGNHPAENAKRLQKAGARCASLPLPPGRQEYQDWCVFVGRQVVWWGSVVTPYQGAALLRVTSRATMNELQFLRRPRSTG